MANFKIGIWVYIVLKNLYFQSELLYYFTEIYINNYLIAHKPPGKKQSVGKGINKSQKFCSQPTKASHQQVHPHLWTPTSIRAAAVCSQSEQRKSTVRLNRTEHAVAVDCSMSEPKSKPADNSNHVQLPPIKIFYIQGWVGIIRSTGCSTITQFWFFFYCFICSSSRASEPYFCSASVDLKV